MKILLVIICLVTLRAEELRPRVTTKFGPVVGRVKVTDDGNDMYLFKGLPFAKEPTGELRFKPPVPPEPWTEDLEAIRDDILCIQSRYRSKLAGVEDCLVLNVATPHIPSDSSSSPLLPVMVYIHGGGFTAGSANKPYLGDPDYLVDQGAVVVSINYRLGPMGFLSTEDSSAPGNYGLLDQIAALQWIQDNIEYFGGDPGSVTIFGISAGGASVHYLMLSPLARGLFHRAISQSGSIFSPWSFTQTSRKSTLRLGEALGCPTQDSQLLIDCLRHKDTGEIMETSNSLRKPNFALVPMLWVPRVDAESADPVLPSNPMDLMKSGEYNKVPWIAGHVKDEGAHYLEEAHFKELIENWDATCEVFFNAVEFEMAEKKVKQICDRIYKTYIQDEEDEERRRLEYIALIGHLWFTAGVQKSVEVMSTHHPVFYYHFAYESQNAALTSILYPHLSKQKGKVCHADDLLYFFKFPETNWTRSSPEQKQIKMMANLWTSFAKTGIPSYPERGMEWPEAYSPHFSYLRFDQETTVEKQFEKEKMNMWKELLEHNWFLASKDTKDEL